MSWVAFKMLTGDVGKYVAIICGVAFASLLITQQSAVFCGVMLRTTSQIRDIHGVDIWVMNPNTRYVDDIKAISDTAFLRVRGVPGVAWTANLYRGAGQAQLESGNYQGVILLGIDDATLVGAPVHLLLGSVGALQIPDAVLVDEAGFHQLWPGEPLSVGKVFQMNDRRAVVVGIFRSAQTFMTMPVLYTRFSKATLFVPPNRRLMPFVLAKCHPGHSPEDVTRRIESQTGLKALTRSEFQWLTMSYYLKHTGIPINIGTTVLLGLVIGCAVAGQTFYLFTVESIAQFGTLKAMGLSDHRLVRMILMQAFLVSGVGYGLGVGAATIYGIIAQRALPLLAFFLPWQVLVLSAVAVFFIAVASSLLSIRRVLILEPATVFQG